MTVLPGDRTFWQAVALCVGLLTLSGSLAGADPPSTGPETEARFPPLVLPDGFRATLFACDPLLEYPSVIALGPRLGAVFVAHDYLTGLGTEIIRRDEIRLLEDADGDGYADRSLVFAGDFNSIQGLACSAGAVYVMHAPVLSVLHDTNGDGVADERRDLLTGLGLPPEENQTRLHCANGVVVGHDGWLYLALGDNGVDVTRPEGDRLRLEGGGILRCRTDGRDLHVFARGLRNIYDLALDEEANVFVRDNENDGGDYMIRICQAFHGSDHGYPYLYKERPAEALPPLADLGRGSSAGVVCYLETAFPPEFRGNLFCCEWGRSVVRYERQRQGSSFAAMQELEFATGAQTDPYGLKPTDIIVDYDGSLLVSDWGDGQRPKRGRGRLYRISHRDAENAETQSPLPDDDVQAAIALLNSASYHARLAAQAVLERNASAGWTALLQALEQKRLNVLGRLHAVWIIAHLQGLEALPQLFTWAEADEAVSVRAQAVRAIADVSDPVLVEHRLAAGRGDADFAARLAELGKQAEPPVLLEVVVALGRLRWAGAPAWLRDHLRQRDAALDHAAMQTLRRCDAWPQVLALLDQPDEHPLREIALRALACQSEASIADQLIARLQNDPQPLHRQQAADLLSRVSKLPAPWKYWGYRPGPRPANSVPWERTASIEQALAAALADPDHDVRAAVLRRMQREQIAAPLAQLQRWLADERDTDRVAAILDSLAAVAAGDTRDALLALVGQADRSESSRRRALSLVVAGMTVGDEARLLEAAEQIEDGPILAELLREVVRRPALNCGPLLLAKLKSTDATVRAAALSACATLNIKSAVDELPAGLRDASDSVRLAAATAAGALKSQEAVPALLKLLDDEEPAVRSASLVSLRQLGESSAVPAATRALVHPATQLAAIDYLAEFGGLDQGAAVLAVAATTRSVELLTGVVRAIARWNAREPAGSTRNDQLTAAIARLQGQCGLLLHWRVTGPLSADEAARRAGGATAESTLGSDWATMITAGPDVRLEIAVPEHKPAGPSTWVAVADLSLEQPTKAQFLAGGNGPQQIWLNGRSIFTRDKAGPFQADADRFEVELPAGASRVAVQLTAAEGTAQFSLRFRPLSSSADHERLARYALENLGDVQRGRELFLNLDKSLCLKCHRLEEQGGKIGPQLSGVGYRFSRIHIIESILEPSRTIAPSYETLSVVLDSGRTLTGLKVAETETMLTLGDDQGKLHEIAVSEIEERAPQRRSTMPDGLEKRFSEREFLDLVTFLAAQKKPK